MKAPLNGRNLRGRLLLTCIEMTLIILAAGTSIPFGDFPKQLLDVGNGKTLLQRQVDQFFPHSNLIYLVTHRDDLDHFCVKKWNPPNRRWKCDSLFTSYPVWPVKAGEKTLVIHGDVYFTDAAVEKILSCTGKPITFFWNDGIEGTEAYGLCFGMELSGELLFALGKVVTDGERNNSPPHDCGLMYLMAVCESLGIKYEKVALTDGTRDFDHPHKHAEWRKAMGL